MHTSSSQKKSTGQYPRTAMPSETVGWKKIPRFSKVAIKLNSLNQMLLQVVKIFLHLKSSIGVLRVFMPAPSTWCPLTAFFFQDGSRSTQGMPSSIAMLKRSWAQGYFCPWTLSFPQRHRGPHSFPCSWRLFASWNRLCPQTNIQTPNGGYCLYIALYFTLGL